MWTVSGALRSIFFSTKEISKIIGMSERVIGIPGYINASDTSAILTAVEELWVKFYWNNFKAGRILNSVKHIH